MVVELHSSVKSSREIGRELDIPADMERCWSRERATAGESSFSGNGKAIKTPEQKEITS